MYKFLSATLILSVALGCLFFFIKQSKAFTIEAATTSGVYKPPIISGYLVTIVQIGLMLSFICVIMRYKNYTMKKQRICLYILTILTAPLVSFEISQFLQFLIVKQKPDFISRLNKVEELEKKNRNFSAWCAKKVVNRSFPSVSTTIAFSNILPFAYILLNEQLPKWAVFLSVCAFLIWGSVIAYIQVGYNRNDMADIGYGIDIGLMSSLLVLYFLRKELDDLEADRTEKIENVKVMELEKTV